MRLHPQSRLARAMATIARWTSRLWLGAALAAAVATLTTPLAAAPSYDGWFKTGPGAAQSWSFRETLGDALRLAIQPKNPPSGAPRKRVMVLYPKASSAYDVAITRVLEAFVENSVGAEFTVINFDNDDRRGAAALHLAETGDYDLILSMGSASTAWLHQYYRGGAIPVVSVCSKDPVELGQIEGYDQGSGSNFAFTSLNMPIEVQFAFLLDFRPQLRNLAILVSSENVSALLTQARPMAALARGRGIEVLELAVQDPEQARAELTSIVGAAVETMRANDPSLANSVFWITGSTAVFAEIATINRHADRVPVLSVATEVVRPGDDSAVLSIGISFESNAHLAATYAIDVLTGRAQAGELKVGVVSPPDIAINFRKARQIGLEIPLSFFESATFIYDYEGRVIRDAGQGLRARTTPGS